MAGEFLKYYTVVKSDDFSDDSYYGSQNRWVAYLHDAAHMTQELAERISRRYPGSKVETNMGYDIHYKTLLSDVGEPSTKAVLATAIRYAKADGWSKETLLLQTEKVFHANGDAKAV